MEKNEELMIETEPFSESQIKKDIKYIDFVYHLNASKIRTIRKWLRKHNFELYSKERIIYIHRYPSNKDTIIGVKRLEELDYFI